MTDINSRGFIRRGNCLVPADFMSEEWLQTLPEGKEVLLDWRKPRHGPNHRHLMMLLHLACEHLDSHTDIESLLDCIKIACGHVRPVMKADGQMIFLPKSINFASLEETKFQRFKERALYVLTRMLGFDAMELMPEIEQRNAPLQTKEKSDAG